MKKRLIAIALTMSFLGACTENPNARPTGSQMTQKEMLEEYNAWYEERTRREREYMRWLEEEQAKAEAQDKRYDALLDKWEKQARRFDAILDRWEGLNPPKDERERNSGQEKVSG